MATRSRKRRAPAPPTPEPDAEDALSLRYATFVAAYDANGGNGTRAYLAAYPETTDPMVAASCAYKLLRIAQIKDRIAALAAARFKRLAMSGDEALSLVAGDARADIRELFDDHGVLLPVHLWPDSVARSVRAVKPSAFGIAVTLNDSLAARRIILEQSGKLKNPLGQLGDLARLLAGDYSDEE